MNTNTTVNAYWGNPIWMGNFDNVFHSALVMFELATEENWPSFMYRAGMSERCKALQSRATHPLPDFVSCLVDSSEPGTGAILFNHPSMCFFFVVCLIVGSMFIKNLFVGAFLIWSYPTEISCSVYRCRC